MPELSQLLLLVVGFVLTTVLGGTFAYALQSRSWRHQHDVQVREQERERAVQAFDEISRLLDRRLYRLRQLYWHVEDKPRGDEGDDTKTELDGYRAVVYEWNESVNRNLALVHQYFGKDLRERLDNRIGAEFRDVGREVEQLWKASRGSDGAEVPPDFEDRIDRLSDLVYLFNIEMIRMIQSGRIGRFNPAVDQ